MCKRGMHILWKLSPPPPAASPSQPAQPTSLAASLLTGSAGCLAEAQAPTLRPPLPDAAAQPYWGSCRVVFSSSRLALSSFAIIWFRPRRIKAPCTAAHPWRIVTVGQRSTEREGAVSCSSSTQPDVILGFEHMKWCWGAGPDHANITIDVGAQEPLGTSTPESARNAPTRGV